MVIILALVVTACGTQSQAAAEPDKVTLQLNWVYNSQFAGFFVADKQGLYTAENLKVVIVPGGADFNPMDKLIAKEVDFALVTEASDVLQRREAGQPVVAIAAIYQKNPNVWISLAEKNIKTPQDMIGTRIGVKPVGEVAYRILLAAAGIDRAKVKDKEVIINDYTIAPLIEGQVDVLHAFSLNEPLVAKKEGYTLNIISFADVGVALPSQILVVREDLVQSNPDLVKRFVRATLKGWDIAAKNPDEGLKATLQIDETLNAEHEKDSMEASVSLISPETAPVGHMDDKMWQQVMQIALDQGLIAAPLELNKAYTTQFLE